MKKVSNRNCVLVGYFQSNSYSVEAKTIEILQTLRLKGESYKIQNYKKIARTKKPLIVHVRMGDYASSTDFGILAPNYFERGILELSSRRDFQELWLFSDEIPKARNMIQGELTIPVREFSKDDFDTTDTFELMRLGYGYVLSNSSYSWWAAKLSYNKEAPVIVPDPWFAKISTDEKLCPENWKKISSKFL
jgi:hypothetical protein